LRVSGALFYIDWEDVQISTTLDNGYSGIANAAAARSQGLELDARLTLSKGWALRAGFAFTDAELSEDVADINGAANAYAGDRLPGSPRYQYILDVDYSHTFDRVTLDTGLSLSRASETYTELNDEFTDYDSLNGYTIAN